MCAAGVASGVRGVSGSICTRTGRSRRWSWRNGSIARGAADTGSGPTCCTSLPATAIRYTECTPDLVAIVISSGNKVDYAAMSRSLRDIDGIDWIRKNQPLPRDCVTRALNSDPERVKRGDRAEGKSAFQDWFGGASRIKVSEDAIGLGGYGKTLTVLHGIELPEDTEDDGDENILESWTPRHRR